MGRGEVAVKGKQSLSPVIMCNQHSQTVLLGGVAFCAFPVKPLSNSMFEEDRRIACLCSRLSASRDTFVPDPGDSRVLVGS